MSGLEKFKVPIIVVAVLAVGAAVFAMVKGGGDAPTNDVNKAVTDVTSGNREGDPVVPENQRTGMAIGEKK